MFLKKIDNKKNTIFFLIFFLFLSSKSFSTEEEYIKKISDYFININNFSSTFIQSSEESLEEGKIFLKKNIGRIKVEYTSPSKIIIILSNDKAMYFNIDLSEVQYFNPQKSIGNIFYDIFYDKNFFKKSKIVIKEGFVETSKILLIDQVSTKVSIIFENNPLKIKQLKVKSVEQEIVMTFINSDFNASFEKDFFSIAHPLLK